MPNEWRQDYTADCPHCGKEATFTTVGVMLRQEQAQYNLGFLSPSVLSPKRVGRIEVACAGCD